MLYIVATPIGNLEDITIRALNTLREADVILSEDTRHTGLLLKHFQIPHKPLISFYDEVESQKQNDLLATINSDKKVVLVSDAGTPLISDPGYKLVREAIKQGAKVDAIPGPTAAITALVLSGLPPDKFLFLGYPPEKESHQRELFQNVKDLPLKTTVIFFISPHKLLKTLRLLKELFGNPDIVIARELTKIHQEIWQGKVTDALIKFIKPKGEFVILWHS